MTSMAFAQMGQKFSCPVYPMQVVRENGANFRIILHPQMALNTANGTPRPLEDIVREANALMENWMRAHPEQWLWVHQRWSSKALQTLNDDDMIEDINEEG